MSERIWVLGAPDPEMEMIERTLRECGETVAYALDERGERVMPATAYRAHCPDLALDRIRSRGGAIYLVECDLADARFGTHSPEYTDCSAVVIRIDHHRPGDPGYGRPPSEFLAASSIGQVLEELARLGAFATIGPSARSIWGDGYPLYGHPLGLRLVRHATDGSGGFAWYEWCLVVRLPPAPPRDTQDAARIARHGDGCACRHCRDTEYAFSVPQEILLTAAADQCLGAAYRGECPGVDPDALMRWRVEQRAHFQGRNAEQILEDIERARDLLSDPDTVELAPGIRVADVRSYCVVTHDCGRKELRHEDYMDHVSHKHGCPGSPYTPRQWCNGWIVEPGIPELPDAASREGVAYLATVSVDGSGRECRPKVVLGGCTTPDMVRAFLDHWAPAQGLVDAYGDPQRGFAGAYLTTEAP